MTERDQFTFYGSFYRAMRRIKKKAARADVYDMLARYALFQEEPDLEKMAPEATIVYELAKPNLDASRKKAEGGKKPASKKEDTGKIAGRYKEDTGKIAGRYKEDTGKEKEKEGENENEVEKEDECLTAKFAAFWEAYPKKTKKQEALAAFREVTEEVSVLLEAVERQKRSAQWQAEGGRFIPNAAAWITGHRWEDDLPVAGPSVPMGCTGMRSTELADMESMLDDEGISCV